MFFLLYSLVSDFQQPKLTAPPEPAPIVQVEQQPEVNHKPLADLIGSAESDTAGGYNAANAGRAMDLGRDGLIRISGRTCSEVTIGEVKAWQRRRLLYAVGRYQMIPRTLAAAQRWAGLSDHDSFSPANQDKMLLAIIQHKRPNVWAYLRHGGPIGAAVMGLAREWAGLPTLAGRSYYGYGNRSHVSVAQVKAALQAARI